MIKLKIGPWKLEEINDVPKNGLKVFSTFSCGGGSTMGYKLAGFEVIGCCEIDKQMAAIYKANHHPKYMFNMAIQDFNKLPDDKIPEELFGIDILDGSPPCSSFSMAGSREKKWGEKHHFREGQAEQHLDDLFFDFIQTAKRLQPKVVVAENVKGLIQGNAKGYVKQIFQKFKDAGYSVQLFLLNAAAMGVPQRRERTFFIANRLDKKIKLEFDEKIISFGNATLNVPNEKAVSYLTGESLKWWEKTPQGKSFSSVHPKKSWFNWVRLHPKEPTPTLISSMGLNHYSEPRRLTKTEYCRVQTFPDNYNFLDQSSEYICGMSVPPFMMQRIANQIAIQLF